MMKCIKNEKGFSFIGILLSMVIIGVLVSMIMKVYFGRPVADEQTREFAEGAGINASSAAAVLESAVEKIHDIEQQRLNRPQEGLDMMGNY